MPTTSTKYLTCQSLVRHSFATFYLVAVSSLQTFSGSGMSHTLLTFTALFLVGERLRTPLVEYPRIELGTSVLSGLRSNLLN